MLQEKKWIYDIISILRDQVDYLKNDIVHKNMLIRQLLIELTDNRNSDSPLNSTFNDNGSIHISPTTTVNDAIKYTTRDTTVNSDDVNISTTPVMQSCISTDEWGWQKVKNTSNKIDNSENSR